MWIVVVSLVLGFTACPVFAQHHGHDHGAPQSTKPTGPREADGLPHHVLAQLYERAFAESIVSGRGFGLAFVADQNGYPGPLHVIELKDQLKLTADQESKVQAMLSEMFAQSRPRSARLVDAEDRLRRLFASARAEAASVHAAVADVERARAEVRLVHLTFHLKTREVLTDEQRRLYHEARWGERGTMRLQRGGSAGGPTPQR